MALVKNPPVNAGDVRDVGLIPGSGRSSGEGNGSLFQYSLENSILLERRTRWLQSMESERVGHDRSD